MKFKILGICLFVLGFALPFLLSKFPPSIFFSGLLSTACFWIGFFLILHPTKQGSSFNPFLKWGRYALWLNILLTTVFFVYLSWGIYLVANSGLLVHHGLNLFAFIANPVKSIFNYFVAYPTVELPDGSVAVRISFTRSLLIEFINLQFYISAGMFLKLVRTKYWQR